MLDWPGKRGDWPTARSKLAQAKTALEQNNACSLLREKEYRSPAARSLKKKIEEIESKSLEAVDAHFAAFDHCDKNDFFKIYPSLTLKPTKYLQEHFTLIESRLEKAGSLELETFLAKYPDLDKGGEAGSILGSLYYRSLLRSKGGTKGLLKKAVAAIEKTHGYGFDVPTILEKEIAYGIVEGSGNQHEFQLGIVNDLAFNDIGLISDFPNDRLQPDGPSLVLIINPKASTVSQRIGKSHAVKSRYVSGYIKVPNPAKETARLKMIEEYTDYLSSKNQPDAANPNNDIAVAIISGLAKGIVQGIAKGSYEQAQQEFLNTPALVDEPVYDDYTFNVSDLTLGKKTAGTLHLVDFSGGVVESVPFVVESGQEFQAALRLKETDPNYSEFVQSYKAASDVEQLAQSSEEIKLSVIIDKAAHSGRASVTPLSRFTLATNSSSNYSQNSLPAAVKKPGLLPDDSRCRSVVVISNFKASTSGAGFYVKANRVVTNYHVVQGAAYVGVQLVDGRVGTGRVLKTDEIRDLALLSVDIAGPPVRLAPFSRAVRTGTTVEAIGHPRGLTFSVTKGVISAVREIEDNPAVEGDEVTLLQTDTPINPGNSGGPLFTGTSVVGVNTSKLGGVGIEGIGFAVHVDHIHAFMASE